MSKPMQTPAEGDDVMMGVLTVDGQMFGVGLAGRAYELSLACSFFFMGFKVQAQFLLSVNTSHLVQSRLMKARPHQIM